MSKRNQDKPASKCIDGVTSGGNLSICETNGQSAPWIALEFQRQVEVTKVVLHVRDDCCAERTKNLEVRITDKLPTSANSMFTGGEQLGSFEGPATAGQIIKVEGIPQIGKYVLIQMDNPEKLTFLETVVFGKVTRTKCQSRAGKGRLYGGKAETTEDGFTCRNWTDKGTIGIMGDRNYCRQPDNTVDKVWCFVSEDVKGVNWAVSEYERGKDWRYCAVSFCGETGDHGPLESLSKITSNMSKMF